MSSCSLSGPFLLCRGLLSHAFSPFGHICCACCPHGLFLQAAFADQASLTDPAWVATLEIPACKPFYSLVCCIQLEVNFRPWCGIEHLFLNSYNSQYGHMYMICKDYPLRKCETGGDAPYNFLTLWYYRRPVSPQSTDLHNPILRVPKLTPSITRISNPPFSLSKWWSCSIVLTHKNPGPLLSVADHGLPQERYGV